MVIDYAELADFKGASRMHFRGEVSGPLHSSFDCTSMQVPCKLLWGCKAIVLTQKSYDK